MSFLVLRSTCWSSLVHFKNCPKYLIRGTAQVFIPLMRFLLCLISSSFLVLMRYSFLIFSFISPCLIVSVSNIRKYLKLSFSPNVCQFGSSGPSVIGCIPLFIISMVHFSVKNYIPISWLYMFTACIRVSDSYLFLANNLMSSMHIFSCVLWSLYPPVYFLNMWLSGIITIANMNGDWSITGFSPQLSFFLLLSVPLQVLMIFSKNFMTLPDIFYILRQSIIQLCRNIYDFLYSFQAIPMIFRLDLLSSRMCWSMYSSLPYLCSILSAPLGKVPRLIND